MTNFQPKKWQSLTYDGQWVESGWRLWPWGLGVAVVSTFSNLAKLRIPPGLMIKRLVDKTGDDPPGQLIASPQPARSLRSAWRRAGAAIPALAPLPADLEGPAMGWDGMDVFHGQGVVWAEKKTWRYFSIPNSNILPDITVTKTGVWVIKIRNWSEGSHFWLNFDRITCFHTKERPLLPRAQDTAPNPLLHVFFLGHGWKSWSYPWYLYHHPISFNAIHHS